MLAQFGKTTTTQHSLLFLIPFSQFLKLSVATGPALLPCPSDYGTPAFLQPNRVLDRAFVLTMLLALCHLHTLGNYLLSHSLKGRSSWTSALGPGSEICLGGILPPLHSQLPPSQ